MWRIVTQHFPKAIQMVDWFHASSYLVKIANVAFTEGSPQALAWLEPVKTALAEGQLGTVIRAGRAVVHLAFAPYPVLWPIGWWLSCLSFCMKQEHSPISQYPG